MNNFEMVRELHLAFGLPAPNEFTDPTPELAQLRVNLIEEEYSEFRSATSKIEQADALADLLYVTLGTGVTFGVPVDVNDFKYEYEPPTLQLWPTIQNIKLLLRHYREVYCPRLSKEEHFLSALYSIWDSIYDHAHILDIPLDRCFAEVHRSNMSKLGDDGKPILREDGKFLKGPNYSPPDLSFIEVNKITKSPLVEGDI